MTEGRPSPFELWQQAGGDAEEYRRLMREHGHLVPGMPQPLPCGWPDRRVMAAVENGGAEVIISAPPGTDPDLVRDMAGQLAANAHLLTGEPRRQCCPMDTYDTDSAGHLRPMCTCDDGCDCTCTDCVCARRWDDDAGDLVLG
jgi:hypothetical protein